MCKVVVLPSLKVTSIKPWERREGPLRFAVGCSQVRAYKSGLGGLLGERKGESAQLESRLQELFRSRRYQRQKQFDLKVRLEANF
jgi:hypothetical protein